MRYIKLKLKLQIPIVKQMKLNTQPKTLQDYRDLTKVLKLKIVKQSKQIQELQGKCKKYEDELGNSMLTERQQLTLTKPTDDISQQQLSTLKGKSLIMRKFLRATQIFGISPQAIYRIADIYYTNSIQSDYFRTVLQKMALNLTPKQISSLIFIFDENCQGFISREDFHNSLNAYEISMQDKSLPYTQQCLLKFCGLVYSERVDTSKFYDQMKQLARSKNSQGQVDLAIFQEQTKKYFTNKLQQRQIVGAFNQINLQKQRSIQKKNFLYGINSFTNRLLLTDQRSRVQTQLSPPLHTTTMLNNNTNQSLKNSRSILKTPINPNTLSTLSINNNNQKGSTTGNSVFMNMNNNRQQELSQVDAILKQKQLKFTDLAITLTQWDISSRLSIHQFKKIIKKFSTEGQFTSQQISVIFKSLDVNQQGSISIQDTINYSLAHYKDVHLILMLIGKLLQVTSTTPQEFWNSQQFQDFSKDISKQKFIDVMAQNCGTADSEGWEFVWAYFDKGKGAISIQSVVDVWKKYYIQ